MMRRENMTLSYRPARIVTEAMALTLQEMERARRAAGRAGKCRSTTTRHSSARSKTFPACNIHDQIGEAHARVAVSSGLVRVSAPKDGSPRWGVADQTPPRSPLPAALMQSVVTSIRMWTGVYTTDTRGSAKARKLDKNAFEEIAGNWRRWG